MDSNGDRLFLQWELTWGLIMDRKCKQCGSILVLDDRIVLSESERQDDIECGIPEKQLVCPTCWMYYSIEAEKD